MRTRRMLNQLCDQDYKKAYQGELLLLYADDMLIEFPNQKALDTWELNRHDTWNQYGMVINVAKSKVMTKAPTMQAISLRGL